MITIEELNRLLTLGESETIEYKSSFTKEVIETIVAFSNKRGGKLLLGVKDDGTVSGIITSDESIQKWINEIKQNTEPSVLSHRCFLILKLLIPEIKKL